MLEQNLIDAPDNSFQGIDVQPVFACVGGDATDRYSAARVNALGLQILKRLPIHQKAALYQRRLFDMLGRLQAPLLVRGNDLVR